MRKKKLLYNTATSLLNQITMVVCAFILPRLILTFFGSSVNGLVSSINQFLTVISFLELGVGAVVQSSLYKPLANKDTDEISKIIASAGKFFRNLAFVLLGYVAILLVIYPTLIKRDFGIAYTDTLILSMSISYFAQYFLGLKNRLLLVADQRGYVDYALNTIVLILDNVLCSILIINGFSIQIVKLTASLVLLLRPLLLELYVRKHYALNKKIKYTEEPIKQKWNGVAQHIASVVLNSTDTIVLTLFSTLSNVSIYNVYFLIVNGLKTLVVSISSGMQSLIGNMLATKEYEKLSRVFTAYESVYHFAVTFIFGCTAVLIVPFVQVYTNGITDANYNVPLFGVLISIANMAYCFRIPYNSIVLAAGHYKQTQNSAWIEMAINIVISVTCVFSFGLIGVAIGTLVAMLYRTFYLVWYISKNIINRNAMYFIKHFIVDCMCVVCIMLVNNLVQLQSLDYMSWILLALQKGIMVLGICVIINVICFRKTAIDVLKLFKKRLKK